MFIVFKILFFYNNVLLGCVIVIIEVDLGYVVYEIEKWKL